MWAAIPRFTVLQKLFGFMRSYMSLVGLSCAIRLTQSLYPCLEAEAQPLPLPLALPRHQASAELLDSSGVESCAGWGIRV